MWGEAFSQLSGVGMPPGLPPLVWGEVINSKAAEVVKGITPTSVGRRTLFWSAFFYRLGLPPPVWGEAFVNSSTEWEVRITPTSVGRRLRFLADYPGQKDYPHQCGEKDRLRRWR
ncbi:hypothetical protein CYR83_01725 [Ligilactobacillus agilis]|nr:hypothetical protein CYR83_01725 [Ligilactobacillus agilis]